MWTNELEFDATIITVMDDTNQFEDVRVELTDEFVDIKQYNAELKKYDLVTITPKMMLEMLEAFKYPEGMFQSQVSKTELD